LYTMLAVRLTVGQQYKIYYDENINAKGNAFELSLFDVKKDNVFSYDILDFSSESLTSDYNVLSTRLTVHEGDIIVTDKKAFVYGEEEFLWDNRANSLVDNYYICSYEKLLDDAEKYLKGFLQEGTEISVDAFKKEEVKGRIETYFLERQKKDNRFRSKEEKEAGKKLEVERIQNLVSSYLYFEKAYKYGIENGWFYSYTKYEYSSNKYVEDRNAEMYQELYKKETPHYYGLNVSALTGGEHLAEEYFVINDGNNSSENVVLMVFDFVNEQRDLQFESLSVINRLIENCTGYKTVEDIPTV
ncbi:MAG: hypothetical protein KBS91_00890, partial [Firmicutes bacterium]|nr:hypothetical protein [Candidatus Caballimonas caccae]